MGFIGIDVGGSSVKVIGLGFTGGEWTGQSSRYSRANSDQLIAAITEAVSGRAAEEGVTAGICVPGFLDASKRRVTLSVNVPGLTEISLDELVAGALGSAAKLRWMGSDAVAGTFDVARQLNLSGRTFGLALGTGVGAAVIDDGKPLFVHRNSPGHWGQVDVSLCGQDAIGPDGGAGSLEAYLGVPAMKKHYGTDDLDPVLTQMTTDEPATQALIRAIRIGHAIYCPDHVVLLGGIGIRIGHLVDGLKAKISDRLTNIATPGWTLNVGVDDWHAARGAAGLARVLLNSERPNRKSE